MTKTQTQLFLKRFAIAVSTPVYGDMSDDMMQPDKIRIVHYCLEDGVRQISHISELPIIDCVLKSGKLPAFLIQCMDGQPKTSTYVIEPILSQYS